MDQTCITIRKTDTCEYKIKPCISLKSPTIKSDEGIKSSITVKKSSAIDPESRDISHINMARSLNNLEFDIIKSGLQKAIRRGNIDAASSYVIEGDFFSLVEKDRAKGNRTNLTNRLRVTLVEDLFDWQVVMRVVPWFTIWSQTRNSDKSWKYLLSIVRCLAWAKKIRLLSDLKVFMARELHRKALGDQYDDLFNQWNAHGLKKDNLSRFKYLLDQCNPNCLHWYQQLYEDNQEKEIWLTIFNVAEKKNAQLMPILNSVSDLKIQLGKTYRERNLYDMYGIALVLFHQRIDWKKSHDLPGLMSDEEAANMYVEHWNKWTRDNLPEGEAGWLPSKIVIDKHTKKGRARGQTAMDFAEVGSVVVNEDHRYYFPILRKIYTEKKVIQITQIMIWMS